MEEQEIKTFWNDWEHYQTFLSGKNFPTVFKQNVDFYEGRQWGKIPVFDIPPVTVNEVRAIIDVKVSNILATPFSVSFRNGDIESEQNTVKLNNFDKAILKELNHDLVNRRLVNSSEIKGVFCVHYYWNEDKFGIRGLYKGGLQVEVINPLWVAVSNPYETDIQKMEWIIVGTPMKVNKVKKLAKDEGLSLEEIEKIRPDDLDGLPNNELLDPTEDRTKQKCVVLTKYFRQNGEVYVERCTKDVLLGKPKPLNPNLMKKKLKESIDKESKDTYEIDPESAPVQDNVLDELSNEEVWNLYPLEMGSLTPSDNSIYGLSDVSDIIMLQKMLNISFATGYKNSLDNVFPKYIVKDGALQQEITGEPNEIITDYSKGSAFGISKIEGIPLSNAQVGLPQTIIEFMKTVSNSRDVLQGDTIGANMSALAIQSLQVQAEKPIAQQREMMIQSLQRMAKIRLLFYKFYYENRKFTYDLDDIDYEAELEKAKGEKVSKSRQETFKGSDFIGKSYDIVIDVGRGTKYDAITAQETLNNLYLNGNIEKMDSDKLEQYIEALDPNIFPYKDNLRRLMRKQRESEKALLTQQVSMLTSENEQLKMELQKALVYVDALKGEFTEKINSSNEQLKQALSERNNAENVIRQIYQNMKQ